MRDAQIVSDQAGLRSFTGSWGTKKDDAVHEENRIPRGKVVVRPSISRPSCLETGVLGSLSQG